MVSETPVETGSLPPKTVAAGAMWFIAACILSGVAVSSTADVGAAVRVGFSIGAALALVQAVTVFVKQ